MLSAGGSSNKLSPLKRMSGSANLNDVAGHGLMQKLKGSLGKLIIEKSGSDSSSPSPLPPATAGKLPLSSSKLGGASPSSMNLNLQRRGTEFIQDRIDGFSKRQKALEKLKQIKEAEQAESMDSEDSLGDEGPYPLKSMKRENTALVMRDDTLIIRIPYKLERGYVKHLENMEK